MPSWWEKRYADCVDPDRYDGREDADRDGLSNDDEFLNGTNPCRPDTDRGGENDGSEVEGGRNPRWAPDDLVRPLGHIELLPLNQRILVNWTRPLSYTRMLAYVSTTPDELGERVDMGQRGEFTLTGLTNGMPYYLTLQGESDGAQGAYSDPSEVVPKEDPVPPQGAFYIGGPNVTDGGDAAIWRDVTLFVDATDELSYEGPISHSAGHSVVDRQLIPFVVSSDGIEMRFRNDLSDPWTAWEPLADEKAWTLDCRSGELAVVFAQFRDGAENESLVYSSEILCLHKDIYLPVIFRQ
jgi:hypothetical protein